MSGMNFQKKFNTTPPDKGSFPLDHDGECKTDMLHFMRCLSKNNNDNSQCRQEAKNYLDCRMRCGLMEKESWSKLGFKE
ncbi:cytochrome c oxidase assembly protein COX19 [Cloeon dipterum]|uniref:cytochrome c oxidase assembly protein COX19 n=1 Tax=Cloeon dipterum TaxID=197152 RepID=UPI00321F61B6